MTNERVMIMTEWYSVPELAKETGIPEPTLRRYLANFPTYFISKAGARGKRYDTAAIDILKRIKQLFDSGYETAGVSEVIANEFPMIMEDNEKAEMSGGFNKPGLATSEEIAKVMEFNKQLLQENRELKELFKMFLQKDAEKTAMVESLANQVENLAKALPAPEQPNIDKQFMKDQQEINQQLLQELSESKQRDQLLLEKLTGKEEEKKAAVPVVEKKKGFFGKFFK
jgi:DNA-binding transcriptional MerR regulator